jgi:hypothetical protein
VRNQILGLGTEPLNLANQDNFIVWAGTRAFIGSKVARVVRVFRLLRLLRLYSLYKRFQARRRVRAALAKAGITPGGWVRAGTGKAGLGLILEERQACGFNKSVNRVTVHQECQNMMRLQLAHQECHSCLTLTGPNLT